MALLSVSQNIQTIYEYLLVTAILGEGRKKEKVKMIYTYGQIFLSYES